MINLTITTSRAGVGNCCVLFSETPRPKVYLSHLTFIRSASTAEKYALATLSLSSLSTCPAKTEQQNRRAGEKLRNYSSSHDAAKSAEGVATGQHTPFAVVRCRLRDLLTRTEQTGGGKGEDIQWQGHIDQTECMAVDTRLASLLLELGEVGIVRLLAVQPVLEPA